jgi:N6-adenosine-specific RNA methylase IME4
MNIEINKIKIGIRHRKNLQNLDSLVNSIEKIGLLHPVVITEDDQLIAGQRRIEAFKRLGRTTIPCHVVSLTDILQGEYDENVVRADFTPVEAVEIRRALEPVERERAKERQIELGRTHGTPPGKLPEGGRVRDKVARAVGMGERTLKKAEEVVDSKDEALIQAMDEGDMSVDKAHRELKKIQLKKKQKARPIPDGEFNVIYADPPWEYDFSRSPSRNIENQYPTMKVEDICNIAVPASKDAVLFLWATSPKLREALKVMQSWNFEYKTSMVWIKDKIGMGYYVRGQHELLLIGTKGTPALPEEAKRPSSVIRAPREDHSKKPGAVYEIIEAMYPNQKYIELFGRGPARTDWMMWGNE